MGEWKIILPEAATNMVLNPVAMGTGNYAAVGAGTTVTPTAAAGSAYLGYKYYLVAGNGDNFGMTLTLAALSNAIHYVTVRIRGAISNWDWSLDNATYNVPTLLATEGIWSVYGYAFPAAQANASTTLYIYKNAAGAFSWQVGHIQVEADTHATTPITGDIKGFTSDGYYWNGTAHASTSSRAAKERSGGVEKDLQTDYNFLVEVGNGSGMPPITHYVQGTAMLPGAIYQGHKVEPRVLDLKSFTTSGTSTVVSAARRDFINAVKFDRVSPDQPTVIKYNAVNTSKPVLFYGYYDDGMGFNPDLALMDQPTPRFICYDPFAYEVHTESAPLTTSASVANADYIVRKINGTWYNISTEFNGNVWALARGSDGCIYIGGEFSNVGDGNGDYIVKWNPYSGALSSLGTGMTGGIPGTVIALATAPNGDIYAGGFFTGAGGVANTNNIAYWDIDAGPAAWKEVGGGITAANHQVNALAFDHSGNLYIGGSFHDQQDANGDFITMWNGTAYSSLGTGTNTIVSDIAVAPNGDIYVTGSFTLAGGVANTVYIARWDGSRWWPLGTGLDDVGSTLAFDKAGNLYVGGGFHNAGGVACAHIAKWNGKNFEPLGAGNKRGSNHFSV